MRELSWEDGLCPIDEEKRSFTSGLCWHCANGPQHGGQLFIQFRLLFFNLSNVQVLSIDARVCDRGKTNLGADAAAVIPESAAGELGAIVGDYLIGEPETGHQSLDELDN